MARVQLTGIPRERALQNLRVAGAQLRSSQPAAESTGWSLIRAGQTPLISQYQGLPLDRSNCGPTSFVMVAKAFGRLENLSDDAAIRWADRVGNVQEFGALPSDLADMADALSLAYDQRAGIHSDNVVQALASGAQVILIGINAKALPWSTGPGFAAHTIALVGLENGSIRVHDPDPGYPLTPKSLTLEELRTLYSRSFNPMLGCNATVTMTVVDTNGATLVKRPVVSG